MATPDPINRKEQYLSKIATGGGEIPARPYTREEQYLEAIAMGGGGGGGAVKSVNGKTGDVVLDATDIKLTTNQQTVQQNFIRVDEEIERKAEIYWVDPDDVNAEELDSHIQNKDLILMRDDFDVFFFAEGSSVNDYYDFYKLCYMNDGHYTVYHKKCVREGDTSPWTWIYFYINPLEASEEYGTFQSDRILEGIAFSAEDFYDVAPDEALVSKKTFTNVFNPAIDDIYYNLENCVVKDQGISNADKVMCTNGDGVVFPLISASDIMRNSNFTIDENGQVWFGAHTTRIHNFYSPYDKRQGIKYSFNFSLIIGGQSGDYGGNDGISDRTADPNTDIVVRSSWMGWADGYVNKIGYVIDKGTANQKIVWKILDPPVTDDEGIKAQAGSLAVAFTYTIPASELPKGTHNISFCALVNDTTYEIGTRTSQYGGGCFSISVTNT